MIRSRTLDSGLKVCVAPFQTPLQSYHLFTPFGGSTLQYADEKTGMEISLEPGSAHYFEHVLFVMPPLGEGGGVMQFEDPTPDTTGEIRDALSLFLHNGAINANAFTDWDVTNYFFAGRRNNDQNLDLLLEFVSTFYMPKDRFKEEVGTILSEAAMDMNNPLEVLSFQWHSQAFHTHAAKYPLIGTPESIRNISLNDLLVTYPMFYRPSNLVLLAVGDVNIDDLARKAQEKLASLGKGEYIPPPIVTPPPEPACIVQRDNFSNPLKRADVLRESVLAGWKVLLAADDLEKRAALAIAGAILGDYGSTVREQFIADGLDERTFDVESEFYRDFGSIELRVDVKDPERFKEYVLSKAGDFRKGFSSADIEYARSSLLLAEEIACDSLLDYCYRLVEFGGLRKCPEDYEGFLAAVERIPAEVVNRYAGDFFDEEHLAMTLMVPDKE